MRKFFPFIIGGGLFLYFLDEIHVVNTGINFGHLSGDFATDAVIGWSIVLGLVVMCAKLIIRYFGDQDEEEEAKEYYYDEEYQEAEVYKEPVKITWWNDYYTDEAPKKSWLNDNWED